MSTVENDPPKQQIETTKDVSPATPNFSVQCNPNYCYRAKVVEVYDGDTVTCDIDLGFGVHLRKQKIRLWGIDTPEVRGEERPDGLLVRDAVREWCLGKDVHLYTIKSDRKCRYGRWLGILFVKDAQGNEMNVNERLLKRDMADVMVY